MAKKSFKQFVLVIDWFHPLPEGNKGGFGYEFFDTLPELKARADELWKIREEAEEAHDTSKPGVPYLMDAFRFVDYASSKKEGLTSAAYEMFARLQNQHGWDIKEWCKPEEWKRIAHSGEELEIVYTYGEEGSEAYSQHWFKWDTYRRIKESKQKKAVC